MAAQAAQAGALARWRDRVLRHAPDDADEVVLQHARIYILPTRRGLAVIATLLTILVMALNYGLALAFVTAFLLTGLGAASLLHTFRNLTGLAIRPGAAGETFCGGSVGFTLLLAARGRERIGIAVHARDDARAIVDIDAEGSRAVVVEVAATHRGRVPLGRVTIASDYPLGLWRGWAYVHFPLTGLAYPAPEPSPPPLPIAVAGREGDSAGGHDDGDLAGLRGYQQGDPLQRVAWKTVARGRGWHTKQFERAGGGADLLLDFAALPAAMDTERKLARLCAWALACERAALPCGLRLPQQQVAVGGGREHRRQMLAALALHGIA